MKKLSKKQKNEIARIYHGSLMSLTWLDPEDQLISEDDLNEIVGILNIKGEQILGKRPRIPTFGKIVEYVLDKQK